MSLGFSASSKGKRFETNSVMNTKAMPINHSFAEIPGSMKGHNGYSSSGGGSVMSNSNTGRRQQGKSSGVLSDRSMKAQALQSAVSLDFSSSTIAAADLRTHQQTQQQQSESMGNVNPIDQYKKRLESLRAARRTATLANANEASVNLIQSEVKSAGTMSAKREAEEKQHRQEALEARERVLQAEAILSDASAGVNRATVTQYGAAAEEAKRLDMIRMASGNVNADKEAGGNLPSNVGITLKQIEIQNRAAATSTAKTIVQRSVTQDPTGYAATAMRDIEKTNERLAAVEVSLGELRSLLEHNVTSAAAQQQKAKEKTELEHRLQDMSMALRLETSERSKMGVSITSLHQELASVRKATSNPEAFQDKITRDLQRTEENLYASVSSYEKDMEAKLAAMTRSFSERADKIMDYSKVALQDIRNGAIFWAYAKISPSAPEDGVEVYSRKTEEGTPYTSEDVIARLKRDTVVVVSYPMVSDNDTKNVFMDTKLVDHQTGDIMYGRIKIYDGATRTYYVSDFSIAAPP